MKIPRGFLASLLAAAVAAPSTRAAEEPVLQRRVDLPTRRDSNAAARIPGAPAIQKAPGESAGPRQLPLSPVESAPHLVTRPEFTHHLWAAEPDILEPTCLTWDERGRLWIAETLEDPNGRREPGQGRDRIQICEDTDGDGRADKFTTFAEKLSNPTGMAFGNGGLLVIEGGHTLFLKDNDGDGKADERAVFFEGWAMGGTHAGARNLRYGLDNWIWGTVGTGGFDGTERHGRASAAGRAAGHPRSVRSCPLQYFAPTRAILGSFAGKPRVIPISNIPCVRPFHKLCLHHGPRADKGFIDMLCCVCKEKEAKVHLTQIVGEKMQKVDLCEQCAAQKGVNDPQGFSLADLLLGLGASQEMEQATGGPDVKCPNCGFTQADFKKAGRLGCSECYVTFAEGLDSLLKTMHKGTKHTGKVPQSLQQSRELADKIKSLEKKLAKAVAEEDFEQAATMRDEIKTTRDKLLTLSSS